MSVLYLVLLAILLLIANFVFLGFAIMSVWSAPDSRPVIYCIVQVVLLISFFGTVLRFTYVLGVL
jgi:hypothetical protein